MSSKSLIRVGILGTGIFANESHLPAIESVKDLELVACANRSKDKAVEFAARAAIPEAKVYDSLESLLDDPSVDVVDILLPSQFTLGAVKDAIAAGKPVAFEKPIAAKLDQAKEIVHLARSTDLPVMVLENFVFWNSLDAIKSVLPQIGDVVYFSHYCTAPFNFNNQYLKTWWRQKPEHVGGFLSDGGVHQVALFTEVLGEVESLSALTVQVRKESGDVDSLTSTLKMKSGVMGTFTYTSAVSVPRMNVLRIHGTTGTIVYDFSDKSNSTITLFTDEYKQGKNVEFLPTTDNGVPSEFENFAAAVQAKDKSLLKVPIEKAFHHFAVICACVESAKKNGTSVPVEVP
ncbi:hypothetical protein V1511DRAFT_497255 [Dipodascopsis uninucleata]